MMNAFETGEGQPENLKLNTADLVVQSAPVSRVASPAPSTSAWKTILKAAPVKIESDIHSGKEIIRNQ